jgi:hypothetical protein
MPICSRIGRTEFSTAVTGTTLPSAVGSKGCYLLGKKRRTGTALVPNTKQSNMNPRMMHPSVSEFHNPASDSHVTHLFRRDLWKTRIKTGKSRVAQHGVTCGDAVFTKSRHNSFRSVYWAVASLPFSETRLRGREGAGPWHFEIKTIGVSNIGRASVTQVQLQI